MSARYLFPILLLLGCSSSDNEVVRTPGTTHQDASPDVPVETASEAAAPEAGPDSPQEAASEDATPGDAQAEAGPVVPPPGTECEYAFFKNYFDKDNGAGYEAICDATFVHIAEQVEALHGCGAKVTLGGMLSLMIYEGAGAKIAFYNDKCAENSYDKSTTCWTNPKARYSYQYGLAPIHTSNFHPCADVGYTSKMRTRLETAMTNAGFSPTSAQIASVASDLKTFCPSSTPTKVDYYILSAHSVFDVPKSGTGNDLKNADKYPFFTPRVVVDLFFSIVSGGGGACASLTSDNAAIAVYGGGDSSYQSSTKQATILKLWNDFEKANCP